MLRFIAAYLCTGLTFLVIDAIWLNVMYPVYRQHLGDLLAPSVNLLPAALFYLLYVAGTVWLAVLPGIEAGGWQGAALRGAVLGLVAYGTYDLTNHATVRGWPATITMIDLAWGTFLTAVASVAGAVAAMAVSDRAG